MTCAEFEPLLLDFVEGELDAAAGEALRRHAESCGVCAARLRATRDMMRDLQAARGVTPAGGAAGEAGGDRTVVLPAGAGEVPSELRSLGDFEVLGEVGRGGMGVVYRARQRSLNRIVALKVLPGSLFQSERSVERFQREAQAAARLHHTNIVAVHAQGVEDGLAYYAMELIEGRPLSAVLAEEGARSEPSASRSARDFRALARQMAEVADAIDHAHRQGVLHRDLKPQNLLLGGDGRLHVVDFGLARVLDEPGLTLSTELVGTPAYMAPEQLGAGRGRLDGRTDVYALGVTLYELLTLRRPFQGATYDQIITQVLRKDPLPPRRVDPRIPPDLDTICQRAMAKEPERRFPDAAGLCSDLRRFAEGFPIASRRIGPIGRAARWMRRRPALATAVGMAGLLTLLLPAFYGVALGYAGARWDAATNVLFEDYRDERTAAEARERIGWAAWFPAHDYRRRRFQVLEDMRPEPERAHQGARAIAERWPEDRDARYLLAWTAMRVRKWSEGERVLAEAEAMSGDPSAYGWFFRGQALVPIDPRAAERAYERAMGARSSFAPAMLHHGRTLNQCLYVFRDLADYATARERLQAMALLQPNKAYPRYLLAISHYLAAETLLADAAQPGLDGAIRARREEEAERAYAASLATAREAQQVEPADARGYAAEAACLESRGDLEAALAAWDRTRGSPVAARASDQRERAAYSLRLNFWLGRYDAARVCLAERYGEERSRDGAAVMHEAVVEATAGRMDVARAVVERGRQGCANRATDRMMVEAAARLLGMDSALPAQGLDYGAGLPAGWDGGWVAMLIDYRRGSIAEAEIIRRADVSEGGAMRRRERLAAVYYCAGIDALAAGRRERAAELLSLAVRQYDNEAFTFRAKFLLQKLTLDPQWPAWAPR